MDSRVKVGGVWGWYARQALLRALIPALLGVCGTAMFAQGVPAPAPSTGGADPGIGAAGQPGGTIPQAAKGASTEGASPEGARGTAAPLEAEIAEARPAPKADLWAMKGLTVDRILFEGVTYDAKSTLPADLEQKAGQPFDPLKVRASTRRLFDTDRYRDITVRGIRHGQSVTIVFVGVPRFFVGRVTIQGVVSDRLASLLEFSTKLDAGTAYAPSALPQATENIRQTLEQNGYYEPKIFVATKRDPRNRLIDVTYTVNIGPQAKVGNISVEGTDTGLTEKEFRKKAKLKRKSRINRDTTSNALANLRAVYQKKDRLEGTVTLVKSTYDATDDTVNYDFKANQGPVVKVLTEGLKVSKSRLHLLVPIFEEGTVDNDLLNEGLYNIKDFLQQQGYFDATVEVKVVGAKTAAERVIYTVEKGQKHKVESVTFKGNKYFSDDLLRERVRVQKADAYLRSGRYSQALVQSDVGSMEALYKANGFSSVKVTTNVEDKDETDSGKPMKVAEIRVTYTIEEGPQQHFGTVALAGVSASRAEQVRGLMNTAEGQPFSLITLTGDRDAVLTYYLAQGFDQARVQVKQTVEKADPTRTDVTLDIKEGPEVFVDKVLISGVELTKPKIVEDQITLHAGDPLDQSALLETQRKLYNLALFNEVIAAVQNPTGQVPQKNVLVEVTEAKRWDVTYGVGFEAQTGTPSRGQISAASNIQLGYPPDRQVSQEGKPGVSPRVSLDVSRINLFGTEKSLTLHTAYGLLETIATLSFQNPNFLGNRNFTAQISGGYTNVQNITTFAASTLQGDFRVTQRIPKTDTLIYDFQYRRVSVDPNSLQVSANLIPQLSQPVRVGGPGISWLHDRRSPSPLDATKGWYLSTQEFLASSKFGSQSSFNRLDTTYSSYYQFGKRKYVFARSTRFGFENVFGPNPNAGNAECLGPLLTTNASCSAVPLPERLYAGGATSLRGFPINGAGPRDLQTGFPVGGTAVFVNTFELRLPAPTLPVVGNSISFVVFHDMGNVFEHLKDTFPSFLRYHQPNQATCQNVSGVIGDCNFNYFSHDVGLGLRYGTPVGPIRADFAYSLNPPVYPVIYDFDNNPPHVGQGGHFNFFFSIGQSF